MIVLNTTTYTRTLRFLRRGWSSLNERNLWCFLAGGPLLLQSLNLVYEICAWWGIDDIDVVVDISDAIVTFDGVTEKEGY